MILYPRHIRSGQMRNDERGKRKRKEKRMTWGEAAVMVSHLHLTLKKD